MLSFVHWRRVDHCLVVVDRDRLKAISAFVIDGEFMYAESIGDVMTLANKAVRLCD